MNNAVKKVLVYIIIISIIILGLLIVYIYPFAEGVRRDSIEQKHRVKKDSVLIIKKESLN